MSDVEAKGFGLPTNDLIVAETLLRILQEAREFVKWDATNDTINHIYLLANQAVFCAERIVKQHKG